MCCTQNQADYWHLERLAAKTDRLPSLRASTKYDLMEKCLWKAKEPGDISAHSLALWYCKICFWLPQGQVRTYHDICEDDVSPDFTLGNTELGHIQLNLKITWWMHWYLMFSLAMEWSIWFCVFFPICCGALEQEVQMQTASFPIYCCKLTAIKISASLTVVEINQFDTNTTRRLRLQSQRGFFGWNSVSNSMKQTGELLLSGILLVFHRLCSCSSVWSVLSSSAG